jgi:UDP-2,4-diacetamido-2,4,6-trideoxy-beta-L-altropyranose hydrolase
MPRVVIRADASAQLGGGHVMRGLALAQALKADGATAEFAMRALPGDLRDTVAGAGFKVHVVSPSADALAGVSESADFTSAATAAGTPPDWWVVDHYSLGARWERAARSAGSQVLAVDDRADRAHDCELLLDQNQVAGLETRYDALLPATCARLLGPRYALLRPEFAAARAARPAHGGQIRRVLVSFGAADATGATLKALEALALLEDPALEVTAVAGRRTPQYDRLQTLCAAHPGWQLLDHSDRMAELMAGADLALGTTGVTTWERCCLGLPAVTLTSADNQEPIADAMADARLIVHLGAVPAVSAPQIADAVRGLRAAPALVRAMAEAGRALVDGRGAQRVARRLLGGEIRLRRAQADDCLPVFEWRNDERTRRYALDPAPLAWDTHRAWFDRMLANAAHVLLIGEDDTGPLGVLRYDLAGGEARVSVYLVPGRQGEGRGSSLIAAGSRWLAAHYAAVQRVAAEILPDNQASVLAFSEAGFQLRHAVYISTLTPDAS